MNLDIPNILPGEVQAAVEASKKEGVSLDEFLREAVVWYTLYCMSKTETIEEPEGVPEVPRDAGSQPIDATGGI